MNQKKTEIVRVSVMPWGMVNAHLIVSEQGCIAVDAGLPDCLPQFEKALGKLGRTLSDVQLIVVTHAHIDHAGGAMRLREKTGAPIVAHEAEAVFLSGERPMTMCPTGWFGSVLLKTRAPLAEYPRFVADRQIKGRDPLDLREFGVAGKIQPTPGHTPGSLSVLLDDGVALAGDMIASGILLGGIARSHVAKSPPFEERPRQVAGELEEMVLAGAKNFYIGHGGPLPADEVMRHASQLRLQAERISH
jgi:hydroxyacylglutathione hydrolase